VFDMNDLVTRNEIQSVIANPSTDLSLGLLFFLMLPRNNHEYGGESFKVFSLVTGLSSSTTLSHVNVRES